VRRNTDFGQPDSKQGVTLNEEVHWLKGETQDEFSMQRNEVVRKICGAMAAECNANFGDRVVSLILTGSAARGEATIVNSDNEWKLLGDAEFLVVVQRTAGSADTRSADIVKSESAKKLRSHGIEAQIDLAVVSVSYLKKLPPRIFSYELRASGRVISGDTTTLELIPKFAVRDISREDAWRLLCNRMIEQLEFVGDLERTPVELTPRLHYATVKLYLDMATSYLVFIGGYAPSYRERSDRLAVLASEPSNEVPFPLRKFGARVAECTSWKLTSNEEDCDCRVELWKEAIYYMRRLWRWEMIQLTNEHNDWTVAGLSARLAKQQKIDQRIRGWMSLVKRRGLLKSSAQLPRWMRLAFHSTPRYLVYQAAAEVAFRLPCLVKQKGQPPRLDVRWREIQALLPEQAPQSNSSHDAVWRKLVDDVLWNYSEYLQDTRA
jgi:predicted nucleotidyltransferase